MHILDADNHSVNLNFLYMKKIILTILAALVAISVSAAPKNYTVSSPDGSLVATVSASGQLSWSLAKDGKTVLEPSLISMTLADGSVYGSAQKVQKVSRVSVDQTLANPLYKKSQVRDHYNEMTVDFKTFALVVRVFDEGAAYRFVSKSKTSFTVVSEQAEFTFPEDAKVTIPYVSQHTKTLESQLFNSFESYYDQCPISQLREDRLAFAPVNVKLSDFSVNITESDLRNYPGMFLYKGEAKGDGTIPVGPATAPNTIKGVWAPLPKDCHQAGHNMLQRIVDSRQDCIAKLSAGEATPWRIVAVAREEAQLLDSDIVWLLGTPSQGDFSWVKVGKVAWDWWNDWNITGVDFKAGVNNATYKYYIDFASAHGIEYVILDEGWSVNKKADLFQVIPEIDLQELVDYGKSKNVGIILWAGYWAFNRDMEKVCQEYSKMGVKGFKVDFLDHDDQEIVAFTDRAAKMCAKYKMMIDLHGMFKPAGLNRTWPNVIGFEGVKGLENMKWSKLSDFDCVTYDVQIPFIRQFAGPMDYTQGAMLNFNKANYRPSNSEPGSQGTRAHQLAMYTVFEAPFTMLCDSPSKYMKDEQCAKFIAGMPTCWDETKVLGGEIGKYCAIARRSGESWYIGVLNNWDERDLVLDLSFVGAEELTAWADGANVDRTASDYSVKTVTVPADGKLRVHLSSGGGWTGIAKGVKLASERNITKLPAPDMERQTVSFMQALQNRKSVREYSKQELSLQEISDLLWAAQGKNREDGRMTSPTARNRQEIRVYVFTKDGVSLYDHDNHSLVAVVDGDHRGLCAGPQAFVKQAPVCLLMVADFEKYGSEADHAKTMVFCDAGIVSENINLYCAAAGLCTVPRGIMNHEGLIKLLGLSSKQVPVLNNPVGYAK